MSIRKVFITGGFGFLGLNLISYIKSQKKDTRFNILAPVSHSLEWSKYNIELINKSILELNEKDAYFGDVDAIILFAGLSGKDRQETKEIEGTNIKANIKILEIAAKQGSRAKVIFPSTHLVYSDPKNPYAETKLRFEKVLDDFVNKSSMSYTSLRITNPYGPHIIRTQGYNYANQLLIDLLQDNDINLVYSGELIKNYIPVQNLSKIIYKIIEENLFENQIINVGHYKDIKMIDFYSEAKKIFGTGTVKKVIQQMTTKEEPISFKDLYKHIPKEEFLDHTEALEKFKKFYNQNSRPTIEDFLV